MPEAEIKQLEMQPETESQEEVICDVGFNGRAPWINVHRDGGIEFQISVEITYEGKVQIHFLDFSKAQETRDYKTPTQVIELFDSTIPQESNNE